MFNFTLTIKLDPEAAARFDRLMNFLEGKDQVALDALVARLKASRSKLQAVINAGGAHL